MVYRGIREIVRQSLHLVDVADFQLLHAAKEIGSMLPRPIWRTFEDSRLVFNGSVVHQTHCIRWVRGVIFCNRCGHYSVAVMKGLALPCKVKSIAGMDVINPTTRNRLRRMQGGDFPIAGKDWPLAEDAACPAFGAPHLWYED